MFLMKNILKLLSKGVLIPLWLTAAVADAGMKKSSDWNASRYVGFPFFGLHTTKNFSSFS